MPKKGNKPAKKRGRPAKPKANNAVLARRIEEVIRIRLDGAQLHDLREYAAEQKWPTSNRQLEEYIARADALLLSRQEKDTAKIMARHLAQRAMLFARSVNGADYRTALAVLQDEARLRGLYPAEKKQIDLNLPDLSTLTPDALDAVIAAVGSLLAPALLPGGTALAGANPLVVAVEPDLPPAALPE